jgi:hypothetical protein
VKEALANDVMESVRVKGAWGRVPLITKMELARFSVPPTVATEATLRGYAYHARALRQFIL